MACRIRFGRIELLRAGGAGRPTLPTPQSRTVPSTVRGNEQDSQAGAFIVRFSALLCGSIHLSICLSAYPPVFLLHPWSVCSGASSTVCSVALLVPRRPQGTARYQQASDNVVAAVIVNTGSIRLGLDASKCSLVFYFFFARCRPRGSEHGGT